METKDNFFEKLNQRNANLPLSDVNKNAIKNSYPQNCISCKYAVLQNIEKHAELSRCRKFSELVNHFEDSCDFHEKNEVIRGLKNLHIDYILELPNFNQ